MDELVIRAPEPVDVPGLTAMANLPGVRAGTLRLPHTPEAYMRARALEPGPGRHPIVGALGQEPVAFGMLSRGVGRRSHAGDLILMVRDDRWGRGVGRAMLGALIELADLWLGLTRLQLEVDTENARAIRLYEAAGFEREGTLRGDAIRDGRLADSHVMGRLRPAPARRP